MNFLVKKFLASGLIATAGFWTSLSVYASPVTETKPVCDQYNHKSRKYDICKQYDSSKIKQVSTMPVAGTLEKDTLYIIESQLEVIDAPYTLPENTSIIPGPDKQYGCGSSATTTEVNRIGVKGDFRQRKRDCFVVI